jgi:hypothetical protein
MAKMRRNPSRNSSHDVDVEREARELRLSEARLRQLLDEADDKEVMSRAVDLASTLGLDTKKLAQVLGIGEATLRSGVQRRLDDNQRQQAKLRQRGWLPPETPHYIEYPPS